MIQTIEVNPIEIYGFIYMITNVVNNKVYVGQTSQTSKDRWDNHMTFLRYNKHVNPHLQKDFNRYGEINFKLEVITIAYNQKELDKLEIEFINKYNPLIYNLESGGRNGKPSLETLERMKIASSGENNGMYGKKHKKSTKQIMSKIHKGCTPWNKGVPCSDKIKQAVSKANKGRVQSFEERRNGSLVRSKNKKYPGTSYSIKNKDPSTKVWETCIHYNGYRTRLGNFIDPLTGSLIYKFVQKEIYNF